MNRRVNRPLGDCRGWQKAGGVWRLSKPCGRGESGFGPKNRQSFAILRGPKGLPNANGKPFAEKHLRTLKVTFRGSRYGTGPLERPAPKRGLSKVRQATGGESGQGTARRPWRNRSFELWYGPTLPADDRLPPDGWFFSRVEPTGQRQSTG